MSTLYLHRTGNEDVIGAIAKGTAGKWIGLGMDTTAPGSGPDSLTTQAPGVTTDGTRSPFQVGSASYPNYVMWVSPPLAADVTISGTMTVAMYGAESGMSANQGFGVDILQLDGVGHVLNTWASEANAELGTTVAIQSWTTSLSGSPTFLRGQRIGLRLYTVNVGTGGGSGYTTSLSYDGSSYPARVIFTETLDFGAIGPAEVIRLRTAAGPDLSTDDDRFMDITGGYGSANADFSTTTVNGPTSGIQCMGAGAPLGWWTDTLQAATIPAGSLVTGAVRYNSLTYAVQAVLRVKLEKTNSTGGSPVTIVDRTLTKQPSATPYVRFYIPVDADVTLSDGDRLHLVLYADDDPEYGTDMTAATNGFSIGLNGGSGSGYESWVGTDVALSVYSGGTPKSGADSAVGTDTSTAPDVALTSSDAGVGADSVASMAAVLTTRTESGVGADAAALSVPKASSDAGVGTDAVASRAVAITGTEAGAGADTAALAVAHTSTDAGAGADTASVEQGAVPKDVSDSAVGSDTASLSAALGGTAEAGAATDTAYAPSAALGATDGASGADAAAVLALLPTVTDSAVATDTGVRSVSITGVDAGAGTDAVASRTVALTGADAGAGSDVAALAVALPTVTDAGSATDTASVQQGVVDKTASDSAVGSDSLASLAAGVGTVDSAAGADSAALASALTSADAGAGADVSAPPGAALSSSDAGTSSEAASVAQGVTYVNAFDAGVGSDTSSAPAVALSTSDAAVASDAVAGIARVLVEAGVASDVAVVAAGLLASDSGVGTDLAVVTLSVSAFDSAVGSDTRQSLAVAHAGTESGAGAEAISGRLLGTQETALGGAEALVSALVAAYDSGASSEAATVDTMGQRVHLNATIALHPLGGAATLRSAGGSADLKGTSGDAEVT